LGADPLLPNLFHICHSTLEAWFAEQSGQHYAVILAERKIGFPTVHIAADFVKPMPYGITLDIAMHVTRLGTSSVALTYLVRAVDESTIRARVRHVVACVDMEDVFRDSGSRRSAGRLRAFPRRFPNPREVDGILGQRQAPRGR
jgi:4-hydroxybenzoyl-CoA thioesterase